MKKLSAALALITICFHGSSQEASFKTEMFSGTYVIGDVNSKKGGQLILVYPESDSTVLFYIHVQLGQPSHNFGKRYGRAILRDGTLIYNASFDHLDGECSWSIALNSEVLSITTMDSKYFCDFGNRVTADGVYKRINSKKPAYFVSGNKEKVYFSRTNPEKYNNPF